VSPANEHELHHVLPQIKNIKKICGKTPKYVIADKGYDATWLREKPGWAYNCYAIIGKRGENNKSTKRLGRYKVERSFAWLYRRYRRLTQRNERLAANYQGFCHLAIACLWLEQVVG
jgi:transposase